jgi:hypothetical protein
VRARAREREIMIFLCMRNIFKEEIFQPVKNLKEKLGIKEWAGF